MQLAVGGHAFDRGQVPTLSLDREHRAALDGLAVDQDRARAALARVASDMSAGEARDVPNELHDQEAGFDLLLGPVAGERGAALLLHVYHLQPVRGAEAPRA